MKGLINAGKFNIKFTRDYIHRNVPNKRTGESELVKIPVSTCAVIFDEKGNALSSGVCSCYFKDHFTIGIVDDVMNSSLDSTERILNTFPFSTRGTK